MKFPFIRALGKEDGWYRVGPLARMNTCDFIPSPLAEKEFENFMAYADGKPNNMSSTPLGAAHRAPALGREDPGAPGRPRPPGHEARQEGPAARRRGSAWIEAPRGTLFHHYEVNANDQITMANLIVSTTNNNEPMNRAVQLRSRRTSSRRSRDHRGPAQPRRGGHPGLRSVPELRHARPGPDAARGHPPRRRRSCPPKEGPLIPHRTNAARTLVLGIGNPGRRDDGLGAAAVERLGTAPPGRHLRRQLPAQHRGRPGLRRPRRSWSSSTPPGACASRSRSRRSSPRPRCRP